MSRRDGQELPSPDRPPLRPTPEQAVVARLLGRPQWLRSRAELQKRRIKEDGQTLHAWRLAQLGDWRRDGPVYAFVRPNIDTFSGSSLVISTTDGFRTLAKANTEIDTPKMSPDGSRIAYADGGTIHVVDISTEESQKVADGRMAAWLDEDTLIVAPET